jgi:Holliday junction resolvase RusA-like endonuclease
MEYEFNINPIGKPRMTQRDKWLNPPRKPILMYRLAKHGMEAYALQHNYTLGEVINVKFVLPMPDSWSGKKKERTNGQPHQSKPDIDNLLKFIMDALLPNGDQLVHTVTATKVWGYEGKIIFYEEREQNT